MEMVYLPESTKQLVALAGATKEVSDPARLSPPLC